MAATNGMDAHAQHVAATAAAEPREQGVGQVTPSARVRHVVSLHLRNFRSLIEPKQENVEHATQLHRLSLAVSPSDGEVSYLTEVSPPAINADWSLRLDQTQASTSKQTTDAQRMWLGQTHFNVSLWAARDDGNAEWQCSQDVKVDLRRMERISGGLSSAFMSKLPANSLVIGIRTSVWSHTRSGHTQQPDELKRQDKDTSAEDVSGRLATDARAHDAVTYYFVPPTCQIQRHHSSRSRVSSGKGRTLRESTSSSHLDHEADVSLASGAGSDPEDSFNRSAEEEEGGYDSETAYELSTSNSSRMGDSVGRPGLDRRRSSNRTIRTLKRDRRPRASSKASSKKRMSADGFDDTSTTSAGPSSEGQASRLRDLERDLDRRRQVQRWQVEREREQEVLERSKWETRMLHSYDREKLQALLERQAATTALCREINDIRSRLKPSLTQGNSIVALRRQASNTRGRLTALEELVERDEGKVKQLRGELQNRREALARRGARLDFVRRQMAEDATDVPGVHQELQVMRSSLHRSSAFLHNRRAHMLEALSLIYSIKLLSPSDLLFSICGLPLPNSPAEALTDGHSDSMHSGKVDEEQIAAALGMAAQLVLLLATYLDTPLHYEIATAGSRAMIRDGISLMNGPRSFPLYSKGVELYRFEYGVFLLNKNIEQLMNVHGLPVLDLRHVLPNLNNLMLTLSSPIAVPPKSETPDVEPTNSNGTLARAPKLHSYRTAGKGEIVLSSSISQQPANLDGEADASGGKMEDGCDKDTTHTPTFKEAVKVKRSPAASWTASLLGWKGGRRPSTSSASSKDGSASLVAEGEGRVADTPHIRR